MVEPLYTRLPGNCFIGMVQVSRIREGAPRTVIEKDPRPGFPAARTEITDTVSATVTKVLRNVCGDPGKDPDLRGGPDARIAPGRRLEFLRPKDAIPATFAAEGLKIGDMAIVLADARNKALETPDLKWVEPAGKKPVLEILIRHASGRPGTAADLAEDLDWKDPDVSASAIHALGALGPRAKDAKAPLLARLDRPDASEHLEETFQALQAIGLEKEEFRKLLEATMDKADLSRTKGLVGMLAKLGPAAFPKVARLAETHPDKWIRYEAVYNLCLEEIKGPAAEALAKKKSVEDPENVVKNIARRILRDCYGASPR